MKSSVGTQTLSNKELLSNDGHSNDNSVRCRVHFQLRMKLNLIVIVNDSGKSGEVSNE